MTKLATIKKEWLDKGENIETVYIVSDIDGGRCDIQLLNCTLLISPIQRVNTNMLDFIKD